MSQASDLEDVLTIGLDPYNVQYTGPTGLENQSIEVTDTVSYVPFYIIIAILFAYIFWRAGD